MTYSHNANAMQELLGGEYNNGSNIDCDSSTDV